MSNIAAWLARTVAISGLICWPVHAGDAGSTVQSPALLGSTPTNVSEASKQATATTQRTSAGGVPQGIDAAAWASIQQQITQSQYQAEALPSDPDRISARNPRQGLQLGFSGDGASITPLHPSVSSRPGKPELQLRTLSIARGNRQVLAEVVSPVVDASRIEYRRDGWTEWFVNTAGGLEHGYQLHQRPLVSDKENAQLRITLAIAGMQAKANADGSLALIADDGHRFRYEKLSVIDADKRVLPASLSAPDEGRIVIAFNDAGARYPVTVDPLIVNEELAIANPGDGSDLDTQSAGTSLAMDSGILLVGAPVALGYGAVYVFVASGDSWILQQRLTAAVLQINEHFGTSVALSGDTALIGAEYSDVTEGGTDDGGAAYVFTRSGGLWAQQARLLASSSGQAPRFGHAVALAGDTALVGAYSYDGPSGVQGAAYVFVRSGSSWAQQAVLLANDGAAYDDFGFSVALSGDTAVVGAFGARVNQDDDGKAYVFTRSQGSWKQRAKLQSPHPFVDHFGYSVALSGDTLLVGAPNRIGSQTAQGAAYVFVGADKTWTLQAELTDAAAPAYSQLGFAVALAGDTVIASAPGDDATSGSGRGSASVFLRSGSSWSSQAKLTASSGDAIGSSVALYGDTAFVGSPFPDPSFTPYQGRAELFTRSGATWTSGAPVVPPTQGATSDQFGFAVAVNGDTALIAIPYDDVGTNSQQGSVQVFLRSADTWVRQAILTAADGAAGDRFGSSVALAGDTAVVGAYYANSAVGAAYVFVRSGSDWMQQSKLTAAEGQVNDQFARSVSLSGDTALIGASGAGGNRGSAYVFFRSGLAWMQQAKLVGDDSVKDDFFGFSVTVSGDTALIGAPSDDIGSQQSQGSAYVFLRSGASWSQQAHFVDADGKEGDDFGRSTGLSGDTALVGSPGSDRDEKHNVGAGFVYVRSGSAWALQAKLQAKQGSGGDEFGYSVALTGDTALIGALQCRVCDQKDQGAAYLFVRSSAGWVGETRLTNSDVVSYDYFGAAVAASGTSVLVGAYGDDVAEGRDGGSAHFFRIGTDYGDAPAPYPTLLVNGGARHFINTDGPLLGAKVDAEIDGQPDSGATGDDINGKSDEDGVSFGKLYPGQTTNFTVTVSSADGTAQLDAWIDFNADGDWTDEGEQICKKCQVNAGANTLKVAVPAAAKLGQTYARFRSSPAGTGKVGVTDKVNFGEVEDYIVKIKAP
jgi:hypothetical protein